MNYTCSCKNCKKRVVGCHADCPDYISFKEEVSNIRKKIHEDDAYVAHKKERRKMTDSVLFNAFCKAFPALGEGAEAYTNVRNDANAIKVKMKDKKHYVFGVEGKNYYLKIERRHVK